MPKLEEAWNNIVNSDQYKNADDEFKKRVQQRFFERTVGSHGDYKGLAPEKQQAVQARFMARLQPQKSDEVGDAVNAGVSEGLKASMTTLESPNTLNEKSKEYMGATKAKLVSDLKVSSIRDQHDAEEDASAGKPAKAIGKSIKSIAEEFGSKAADFAIPGSLAEAGGMEATGGAIEAAGKTGIGNAVKTVLTEPFGEGYGESIIQKIRNFSKTPVPNQPPGKLMVQLKNPLQSMIEEEMNYEKSLRDKAVLNGNPQYTPFLPEVRTNLSQLKDVHAEKLKSIQAEPNRIDQLSGVEKQVNEEVRYEDKLKSMGPGRDVPPPTPLSPEFAEKPQPTGLLVGKEKVANRQPAVAPETNISKLSEKEQELSYETSQQNKAGLNRNVPPTPQPPLINDPDTLKFGASRNLNDITQKPLRHILKEINDDLGSVGALRFGSDIRAVGGNDPNVLNAAKDLRAAIKTPDGKVHVAGFGEPHVAIQIEESRDNINGFYDNLTKKFITREEASDYLGVQTSFGLMGEHLEDLHHQIIKPDIKLLDSIKDVNPETKEYLQSLYAEHPASATGKMEKGLHTHTLENIKKKTSKDILKAINKEFGEKGAAGSLGEADPAKWDRLKQNSRELARRAWSLGYETTEDIIAFAARNSATKEQLHFLEAELGATAPGPFDSAPIKDVIAAQSGNRDMRNTLWEKVKDRWTPNGRASQVRSLLQGHYGEIAEGHLDSQYFIHNTTKQLTKAERQALTFVIEGAVPKTADFADAADILPLAKRPTENMKVAAKAIKGYMEEAHKFLADNFHDVGYIQDYISHLWDKPTDTVLNPKSNMLGTYNPFVQQRSWPSYAQGIDSGGTPKTLDVAEILARYDKYKIKTVANLRFIDELSKMPTPQGLPAVMNAGEAPVGWIRSDVPALIGKRVHPDYKQAIKTITDAPFSNKALRAYDLLSESQRYASLTLSPFHFGSLFVISSLSTDMPFKIPLKLATETGKYIIKEAMADEADISFTSKLLKAYQNGHAAFVNMPVARRAARAGLNMGRLGDAETGGLTSFLKSTEAKLDKFYVGKGIKAIRGTMDVFSKPLWDYFHAGVKLMTWQEQLTDNMKKFPDMPLKEIEQKTARFVNDLDGGQAWQTLFVSPQYQKSLNRTFFFPDWMVSRLRTTMMAIKPAGLTKLADAMKRTPEGYQAQKFWLRAGLAYYTSANWLNYVRTKKDDGEGKFMWNNDPGHEFDVYKGRDEKTGRKIYTNYAPAITETFKWFQHPIKSLGTRFNPNLNLMTEFFTGSTLSGYKLPENQRDFASIMKRHYSPVILQGGNDAGLFPTSRGMSSYEVIRRFEGVIKNGDDPAIAIKYGVENGYNVEQLYNMALRNVKQKMKKEALSQ